MASNASSSLETLLRERILILDGAMGTMIQGFGLTEADFRGARFADHPDPLAGNNDLLCLTRPDVIEDIHRQFLVAGADIVETNTFNSTLAPQSDYNTESLVYEINVAAARIARAAAVSVETPEKPRFVAGAMGPTNRSLSLSPKVEDPAFRAMRFDAMAESYAEQARGLLDGGVDLLLVETAFDTLNLKSALAAIEAVFADKGVRVPIMLSTTITDASGRTLSGQTIEAFWTSVAHAEALAVGINCALGPKDMRPHIEALSRIARTNIICYPNAGLPNAFGEYDLQADKMASFLGDWAEAGWLNIAGGCCGTTPAHIKAIAEAAAKAEPRREPPAGPVFSRFSGMEMLEIRPESNFIIIGERTNVTGSRKFARLIRTGDYEGAVSVARHQVEGGANILDINMDEGLLDSEAVMEVFLNLLAGEPDVARLPFMLDSSRFSVIEAGLKCVQGKAVVNSISLKEGEDVFKAQARTVLGYGAAVVVMAFDEEGQAVDVERKVAILSRAHKILIEEVGFAPQDIFFDPNILTVATGIEEHNGYGVAFIEATRQLKQKFPQAKVIGGVSNISFSFRGNNRVREAMHSAFLYHAIRAGMAGGIVNAGQIVVYDEIEPDLLEAVEDVILNRRADATERLVDLAERFKGQKRDPAKAKAWRSEPLAARLSHALVHGLTEHMDEDVAEAIEAYDKPLDIIEGPLMAGMSVVGDLFGAGKMFLPQVVKSARAMKKAVAILEPLMDAEREGTGITSQGKILMATVKGDVHDIGKNIVGVVLGCNGYEIIDLGVMVPAAKILATAREHNVDAIGLSGLITPSLDEMVHVARELQRENFDIPLLIGGATTSRRHTSVKIAPGYDHTTVHVLDASRAATVVGTLLDPNRRPAFDAKNRGLQARDRDIHAMRRTSEMVSIEVARANAPDLPFGAATSPQPAFTGRRVIESVPLEALVPLIDWTPFFVTWELRGRYPAILDHPKMGAAARDLFANAKTMLDEIVSGNLLQAKAVYGFYEAKRDGDDIHLSEHGDPRATLHMLRQQRAKKGDKPHRSLADYIAPAEAAVPDWMGAFAVTSGIGLDAIVARYEADHDDYNAILAKALADRLAEACAEWLHKRAREDWGFGKTEDIDVDGLIKEDYRGIRPAPGYPACPDHTEKPALFDLLGVTEATTIALTESLAMTPASSVCGWLMAHPEARYFNIGPLGRDQVTDYAARKGMRLEEAERWLSPSLGYEP